MTKPEIIAQAIGVWLICAWGAFFYPFVLLFQKDFWSYLMKAPWK